MDKIEQFLTRILKAFLDKGYMKMEDIAYVLEEAFKSVVEEAVHLLMGYIKQCVLSIMDKMNPFIDIILKFMPSVSKEELKIYAKAAMDLLNWFLGKGTNFAHRGNEFFNNFSTLVSTSSASNKQTKNKSGDINNNKKCNNKKKKTVMLDKEIQCNFLDEQTSLNMHSEIEKKKVIRGIKKINDGKFRGAEDKIWYCIKKVHIDCTENDIIKYLEEETSLCGFTCERLYRRNYQCFKVSADYCLKEKFENPNFWPEGLHVEPFNFSSQKKTRVYKSAEVCMNKSKGTAIRAT